MKTFFIIFGTFAMVVFLLIILDKKKKCDLKKRAIKAVQSLNLSNNPTTLGEMMNELNINLTN